MEKTNEQQRVEAFREGVLNHGLRYVDVWGAHGVVERPSPCGCRAVGKGHLKDPLRVQFCAAHAGGGGFGAPLMKSRAEIEAHKAETERLIAERPDDDDFARWEGALFTLEWLLGAKVE